MADISTLWDATRGDWALRGADLARGNDIVTAVLISLFSDRVADPDDTIPDGTTDPRGWWGDATPPLIGSRLWLIERSKQTQQTLALAQGYLEEALQWLIDDGASSRVDVQVEWSRAHTLAAQITVYRPATDAPLVKIETPDVQAFASVSAWAWNAAAGVGEWQPVLLFETPPAPTPPLRIVPEGSIRITAEGNTRTIN
jgi:phage gp46-like protein